MNAQAVALGGGRIVIAEPDARARTLMVRVLDSAMAKATGVIDSAPRAKNSSPGYILPFRGDSAALYDNEPTPGVFLIIGPEGKIARTMASPAGWGLNAVYATRSSAGATWSSTMGLLYLVVKTGQNLIPRDSKGSLVRPKEGDADQWLEATSSLLRMTYDARHIDTVARLGNTNEWTVLRAAFPGTTFTERPFPFYDEAVATSDGTVALFRAREYRVDWIKPDGTLERGKSLQYPWIRISDDLRQHIIDSVNGGRLRVFDSLLAQRAADSARTGAVPTVPRYMAIPGTRTNYWGTGPSPPPNQPLMLTAQVVPDFYPPTTARGSVLADGDGNVWVRASALSASDGSAVWEVMNRAQGLIDRVRLPAGATIAGFRRGGIIYILTPDAGKAKLQEVRIR
jgi:hypothetical protein